MKLPGWMASMLTRLATVTVQVGVICTTCSPLGVATLSVVSVTVSTLPRTTVGVGGVWAATVVATRARAALSARAVFITLDCDASKQRCLFAIRLRLRPRGFELRAVVPVGPGGGVGELAPGVEQQGHVGRCAAQVPGGRPVIAGLVIAFGGVFRDPGVA